MTQYLCAPLIVPGWIMTLALLIYLGIQWLLRCNWILNISCNGTDSKDKSCQLCQEVNPNTHQCTMLAGCFQPAISSTPLPPVRHLVIIDSETEPESNLGSSKWWQRLWINYPKLSCIAQVKPSTTSRQQCQPQCIKQWWWVFSQGKTCKNWILG